MRATQRRLAFGAGLVAVTLGAAYAYHLSLVPATHPDHDHGIMNIDAGGRLVVETRDGKGRNLVGAPGKVLVVHFFSTKVPECAAELRAFFELQERMKSDPSVDFIFMAREPDFATLDAWLAQNGLKPPVPASLVLDPSGDTTHRFNAKRTPESMFFSPKGKLSWQPKGPIDWAGTGATAAIEKAKTEASID